MPSKGRQRTKSQNLLDSIPRLPKKEPPTQKSKSVDELLGLTKEQLKTECRKRGQKSSGNKQELLQRLGYKMATRRKDLNSVPNTNGSVVQNNVNNKVADQETSPEGRRKQREREIFERKSIVLWKKPLLTLEYFFRECFELITEYSKRLLGHRIIVFLLGTIITSWYILLNIKSPFQQLLQHGYRRILWGLKWLGLGTASSVGFGVGFHTFLLYLGPHIARVTIAAYSCGTLNFTEPPYPDEIICPEGDSGNGKVSILRIMSKVRLEAILWGAGTALGELPPYFMARAARQSGVTDEEDEDLKEFEELQRKQREGEPLTYVERGKLFVENLVQKVGFFGILLCASVPNPLFDLAGITCGHFLVPFWTFFGATLIGKAIVKMHIQKLFVIIAFSETLIETALSYLALVPMIGQKLQAPFKEFLDGQKDKFHHASSHADESSVLNTAFSILYLGLFICFVLPIVNAFAQSYHKRIHKKKSLKAKQ